MLSAFHAVLGAAEPQGRAERGGPQVLGFHLARESHDPGSAGARVDGLAHCLIEQSRDDAAVHKAVRPLKTSGKAQGRDCRARLDKEAQAHANAILCAAAKAVVLIIEKKRLGC